MEGKQIIENSILVEEKHAFRMLKDCLFFINSIGKQDEFLNFIPKVDRDLYLCVWD